MVGINNIIDPMKKAQEPRVMTLDELKENRICWVEDIDDGMDDRLFPALLCATGKRASGEKALIFLAKKPWAFDTVDNYEWWYDIKDFNRFYRCWSTKPTDEQREAVEWDD